MKHLAVLILAGLIAGGGGSLGTDGEPECQRITVDVPPYHPYVTVCPPLDAVTT
jgi:hypothetical protein